MSNHYTINLGSGIMNIHEFIPSAFLFCRFSCAYIVFYCYCFVYMNETKRHQS